MTERILSGNSASRSMRVAMNMDCHSLTQVVSGVQDELLVAIEARQDRYVGALVAAELDRLDTEAPVLIDKDDVRAVDLHPKGTVGNQPMVRAQGRYEAG